MTSANWSGQLVFWSSFEPVPFHIHSQLPAVVHALPDLQTWLGEMASLCSGDFVKIMPLVETSQYVDFGNGDVGSGGDVPVYITQGLRVTFEYGVHVGGPSIFNKEWD